MEERKRARLIYNPTSGQEIMKKNVAEVLEILKATVMKLQLSKQLLRKTLQRMKLHVRRLQTLT